MREPDDDMFDATVDGEQIDTGHENREKDDEPACSEDPGSPGEPRVTPRGF